MKNQTQRQYLGETVDACNRAVDVFREGETIVIKYKESQHESQQLISYLQAQTFEDLLWTPYAAFKGVIDLMNGIGDNDSKSCYNNFSLTAGK